MHALMSRFRKQKRRWVFAAAAFCAVLTVVAAWPQRSRDLALQFELDLDADTDHTGFVEHSAQEDEREDVRAFPNSPAALDNCIGVGAFLIQSSVA